MNRYIVYAILTIVYLSYSLISFLRPKWIKKSFVLLREKELLFIIGIFEIVFSLMALYYRYQTKIPFIITMVSILMFIDAVFNMVSKKAIEETYEMVTEMGNKYFRIYGILLLVFAGIFFIGIL